MRRSTPLLLLCLLLGPSLVSSPGPVETPRPAQVARYEAPVRAPADASEDPPYDELAYPYVDGQYLVAPPPGEELAAFAARVGAVVIEPQGRSGYGVLAAEDPDPLYAAGARATRLGRIVAAGKKTASKSTVTPPTWHLKAIDAATTVGSADWHDYRVAVLDTGVAYETTGPYVRAPGLATVAFEDALDLVHGDEHPNDDHQHGTHVTSLIASQGAVPGVVPGVTIVPIKVLDSHASGTEYALVEGLYHAIDHDVDVINLSLSFPLGYVPSPALREALEAAWSADVVVVAAAGNDGERELTWPAASRLVVSVGASKSVTTSLLPATVYSDTSPALDVLAPGGQLDGDFNGDGYLDGVVAETIDPLNPARVGWWGYQGTSQAAALVSGVAVQLLASGVAPRDVGPTLQRSRGSYSSLDAMLGTGADVVSVSGAKSADAAREDLYVGLLPYLAQLSGDVDPRARVAVVDAAGQPVVGATVVASMYSDEGVWWPMCITDAGGACTLRTLDFFGDSSAWAFRVDAVLRDGVAQRPSRALWGSFGAEVLLSALEAQPDAWNALGVYWEPVTEPELGPLAEAWAVIDTGTGLLSSPVGLLFQPSHVSSTATPGTLALDLDGTGLLSSPYGTLTLKTLTFSGSGLLSSPYGSLTLVGLNGTGLLSSPLGFKATDLYSPTGSGLLSSPYGTMSVVKLDTGTAMGSALGDATALFVDDQQGVVTESGYAVTDALVASGVVGVGLVTEATASPASSTPSAEWTP